MKNNLFNSFSNIDDDLLDMTAKKIKCAKPRKIALQATGFVAAAAATVFAVNLGVSFVNKNKLPVQEAGALYSESSSGDNSKVYEKYFEPYQGKEFVIDYDNLPFKCNIGELTKLKLDPIVNYTEVGIQEICAYDISEYIGNNPWNENLKITELPVFNITETNNSNEFERIRSAIKETGITASKSDYDNSIKLSFPETLENFPQNYNDDGKIYADEMKRIAGKYSDILGFTDYELDISNDYVYHEDELLKCWHTHLYQSSENAFEAILNYNFNSISFYSDSETNVFNMYFQNTLDSLECIGFYPIISADEAREMLIENPNKYYPNMFDDDFFKDDANVDRIKSVELVYLDTYSDECLPYYKFIVEIDGFVDETKLHAEGIKSFISVFVPAIESSYIYF